ncbi:alpha/beta hydrolase [Oceanobacter sp. 3_MG-2023]|uniref:alpha/beta hydrolase n=1 Tax=Oceanobacter sp. 3_MG-2023 TaxID=3062622 RepID=UPI0027353E60|nr:alpha/beta fold hydrolase [Oceanobacter sp. 3_MG-2023]MDP2504841.1 alpha/beta fold hydrolase [Oceanobacter sp. 3_MG-2023]
MAQEQVVQIKGSAGVLDGRTIQQGNVGMLMCHPHPLFDGTMDNKVVTTTLRTALGLGMSTLRFNFRGVGESDGEHDHGRGEQQDVLAALDYARDTLGWETILLGGFSFGAGMACLAAVDRPEQIAALYLMAPAVHHFDAPNTLPHEFETFVYMGDADEVVPFDEVEHWTNLVVPVPHWQVFAGGGHFFHGRLGELKKSLVRDMAAFKPD